MENKEIFIKKKFIDQNRKTDDSHIYWNNESLEKKKLFVDIDKLKSSQEQQFFINELDDILTSNLLNPKSFLSIGCGNLWIESNVLNKREPSKLVGIDFSEHRVHQLAPKSIISSGLNFDIELICGDILKYDSNEKFDVIYLSKAFHHIESPIFLLRKLKDLLSDNGVIIITGEHYFTRKVYLECLARHFVKFVLRKKYRKTCSFFPEYAMLFPYSLEKGDLHYSLFNYDYFFKKTGMNYKRKINKNIGFQCFMLSRA